MTGQARRRSSSRAPRRIDVWVVGLTTLLAYVFMLAMAVAILFPNLDVHEGWKLALLYAAEVFLLLRAYIAFRARSTIEGVMFVMIFLIVLAALL
jgi:hypothetical protein